AYWTSRGDKPSLTRQPGCLAAAPLQHATGELRAGQVVAPRRQRLAVEPHSAFVDGPPRLTARRRETAVDEHRGQMDLLAFRQPVLRCVSGQLALTEQPVEPLRRGVCSRCPVVELN